MLLSAKNSEMLISACCALSDAQRQCEAVRGAVRASGTALRSLRPGQRAEQGFAPLHA